MVDYELHGHIAVVRLNRPAKRNALTAEMLARLEEIFRQAAESKNLRAMILTGAGEMFSAGTDIAELAALDVDAARAKSQRGQRACDAIELCPMPVIAAINGAAIGGGCELALACHLRVAAQGASFSLPETHLGLLPAYGGTQRLASIVGRGRALAVMLAGETIAADEALRLGIVNRVVEDVELMHAATALAETIALNAPLAVRACLRAVIEGSQLDFARGLELEAELFARLFATEDTREGATAFLEKRKPKFKGA